ncbi:hypothetical protein WG66_016716 [Moniliophthora roreri]|nr:hypothetical protein WG66_016716 [Moniliophthora roreri]
MSVDLCIRPHVPFDLSNIQTSEYRAMEWRLWKSGDKLCQARNSGNASRVKDSATSNAGNFGGADRFSLNRHVIEQLAEDAEEKLAGYQAKVDKLSASLAFLK